MKPQYQHTVMTSFLLWFDNYLLNKGEAFSSKTGTLQYFNDTRLPDTYNVYASPYKQWVNDSSITNVVDGVFVGDSSTPSGRSQSLVFDFENGRVIDTGNHLGTDKVITGTFAVKDFNVYLTNETEEDLILESKFVSNSRYGSDLNTGIKPYDQVVPAVFINNESVNNAPFAFGGEDETRISIKAVVMAEDSYSLDGILSIFADSTRSNIDVIPFSGHPATEYGDLDGGSYNYDTLKDSIGNGQMYIDDVVVSKLSDQAKKQSIGSLKIGFIDFEVHQHRFPRL